MKKMKYMSLLLAGISLISCKHNSNDPEQLGKEFCACMKENNAPKEYLYALTVCDGQLIQKYPYYKYNRVEQRFNIFPNGRLSYKDELKVGTFMNTFDAYVDSHCCHVALYCPPDTLYHKK